MTAQVITIDGPSGSGKGTVCALLAQQLGWHLLDSGALYRLLALAAEQRGVALEDEAGLAALAESLDVLFTGSDIMLFGQPVEALIRNEQIGAGASQVAALPLVRAALLNRQRAFAKTPGLIADGRDMGTVVFPTAPLKVFLTASAEERAQRRFLQLKKQGADVSLPCLLEEIQARDARDMNRAVAPLKPALDALELDSTALSIEQVLQHILAEAAKRGLAN